MRSLGVTLSPFSESAPGIASKVIHSMSMTEAPNEREANIRGKIKRKFLDQSIYVPEGKTEEANIRPLPGLEIDADILKKGGFTCSVVDFSDIRLFANKIVRGTIYLKYRLYVEKLQEIRLVSADEPFFALANESIELPGLIIKYGVLQDPELPAVIFRIQLWNKLTIRAVCMPRDETVWHNRF